MDGTLRSFCPSRRMFCDRLQTFIAPTYNACCLLLRRSRIASGTTANPARQSKRSGYRRNWIMLWNWLRSHRREVFE